MARGSRCYVPARNRRPGAAGMASVAPSLRSSALVVSARPGAVGDVLAESRRFACGRLLAVALRRSGRGPMHGAGRVARAPAAPGAGTAGQERRRRVGNRGGHGRGGGVRGGNWRAPGWRARAEATAARSGSGCSTTHDNGAAHHSSTTHGNGAAHHNSATHGNTARGGPDRASATLGVHAGSGPAHAVGRPTR